ncbi:MAG: DUF4494 family protein [Nanoarchaeota archaeon]
MNQYFKVSVKIETEGNKGKIKYVGQDYLVWAINPTDAEKKVTDELSGHDFEVRSIVATKFVDVIK